MRINYVVCVCIHPNRSNYKKLGLDLYDLVKRHIDALDKLLLPDVEMVTFVVNMTQWTSKDTLRRIIEDHNGPHKFELKFRENWGRSYGVWEDQIRETLGEYDAYFMMEDDYIPIADEFYKPFVDKLKNNTGMVVMWYTNHPAYALGLISKECCEDLLEKEGEVFFLYNRIKNNEIPHMADGYHHVCKGYTKTGGGWQACYHKHLEKHNWKIKDIQEYPLIFREPRGHVHALNRHPHNDQHIILPIIM